MATLLELAQIEANSVAVPGEPPDPAVVAARELRLRVRFLLCERALTYLQTTPALENQDHYAYLDFTRQVLRDPDAVVGYVFRLLLADAPSVATPAQILASTDAALNTALTPTVLARLARAMGPPRDLGGKMS